MSVIIHGAMSPPPAPPRTRRRPAPAVGALRLGGSGSFLAWVALAACLGAACGKGSAGESRDAAAGPVDAGPTRDVRLRRDAAVSLGPDARALPRCEGEPGSACATSDLCAITAACGEDGRCHVTLGQRCDDGLACTADRCLGQGRCAFEVEGDNCLVWVREGTLRRRRCMQENESNPNNPCERCRPRNDKTTWTKLTASLCDDGDPCTTNDHCETGRCVGEPGGTCN